MRLIFYIFLIILNVKSVYAEDVGKEVDLKNDTPKISTKKIDKMSYDAIQLKNLVDQSNRDNSFNYGLIRIVDEDLNVIKDVNSMN